MHLSEREQYILQCLLSAANGASERTGHKGSFAKMPKYDIWLTTEMMRSLLPFLDLYRVVVTDNRKAAGKMTGVDADIYSKEYLLPFMSVNAVALIELRLLKLQIFTSVSKMS